MYDIHSLVSSLVGKSLPEIQLALRGAANVYRRITRKGSRVRGRTDEAFAYAPFAKGALFFLFGSDFVRPNGVPDHDWVRITPLLRDLVERGLLDSRCLTSTSKCDTEAYRTQHSCGVG